MAEQRLIDANVVYEMGHRTSFHIGIADLCDLKELLSDVPTVDAVPVVHGRWKVLECDGGEIGGYAPYVDVECSNCGLTVDIEQGQYGWAYGDPFPWKCCPFCEAKMDGGDEE